MIGYCIIVQIAILSSEELSSLRLQFFQELWDLLTLRHQSSGRIYEPATCFDLEESWTLALF